jgi:hypothetical protein
VSDPIKELAKRGIDAKVLQLKELVAQMMIVASLLVLLYREFSWWGPGAWFAVSVLSQVPVALLKRHALKKLEDS